jgi:diketogulonate reductase-like aldo/keto reductase
MTIPVKQLKTAFQMPSVGKGTWMPSHRKKHPIYADEASRVEEMTAAFQGGITYIDTAERYGNGNEEQMIARAINELKRNERDNLFLASKVSSENLSYEHVILAAKGSIKRMHSSYIDLYSIHRFNPKIALKETMRGMDHLIEKKLIKFIGVCDFTIDQLKEAQSYTKNRIVANQVEYNFMLRGKAQKEMLDYCQKNDIMLITKKSHMQESLTEEFSTFLDELAKKI